MFNRRKTYTLINEDGSTRPYDLSAFTGEFGETGVHFLIHVIHKEKVTIKHVRKLPEVKPEIEREEREFLKPVLLAEEESKENLGGVSPNGHPEQIFLDKVPAGVLTQLKSK